MCCTIFPVQYIRYAKCLFFHVQVSYIIMNGMNGTTWDLEVKGINRTKRSVPSADVNEAAHLLSSDEVTVPFVDTRNIPRDLIPLVRPRLSRWVVHKRTRRGNYRAKHHRNFRNQRNHTDSGVAVSRSIIHSSDTRSMNRQNNRESVSVNRNNNFTGNDTTVNRADHQAARHQLRNEKTLSNSGNVSNVGPELQEDSQLQDISQHRAQSRSRNRKRKRVGRRSGKATPSRRTSEDVEVATTVTQESHDDSSIIKVRESL